MKVTDAHPCGIDSGGSPVASKLVAVRPDSYGPERHLDAQGVKSPGRVCSAHHLSESATACRFPAASDFRERPCVSCDGFRHGLAIDELPFAAALDQPGFAQNLQMVRNGCGSNAAHRNDLAAIHVLGCRDGLKNPEACFVGQGFRYFLNLRTVHGSHVSVAKPSPLPSKRTIFFRHEPEKTCNQSLRQSSKYRNHINPGISRMQALGDGQAEHSTDIGRPT
jgi:hypothetical protein